MTTNPKDLVGTAKVPQSVVSRVVVQELALAMLEGSLKYGRHNYRVSPIKASIYFDACNRHMDAWWEGENVDPDSGLSHVIKAIASLTVLRDSMISGQWIDDRPPQVNPAWMEFMNSSTASLMEKYPEPKEPVTNEGLPKLTDKEGDVNE